MIDILDKLKARVKILKFATEIPPPRSEIDILKEAIEEIERLRKEGIGAMTIKYKRFNPPIKENWKTDNSTKG